MVEESFDELDRLYELREENNELRRQITYLQEELASAEDEVNDLKRRLDAAQNWEC